MSVDLEYRRLAIARAFREARTTRSEPPTESLPRQVQPHDELTRRLEDVERAVSEVRLQVAHVMTRLDRPGGTADLTDDADDAEDPDGDAEPVASRPSVPPLELAGLMSPVASRALFGHS